MNSALWSDGAYKSRWIALPGSARISFASKGEWGFPAGTVFIKHFELSLDEARPERGKRLETRFLVVGDSGSGYGATYKWRADGSDADLLSESLTEEVAVRTPRGLRTRKWYYPSRSDCLVCHTQPAGFVLGVKTRQLNGPLEYAASGVRDNQLRAWNHLQMFEPSIREEGIPAYDRLCAISDNVAPLEHRVRSYLDSNCANCHRPGGARGLLDARYDTPLAEQNIIEGALVVGDLDTPGARSVAPGDLSRSILYQRMKRLDVFKMPPLAMNEPDSAALSVFAEWIQSLP